MWLGCGAPPASVSLEPAPEADDSAVAATDRGAVDRFGSVVLRSTRAWWLDDEVRSAGAVFVDDDGGLANAAGCLFAPRDLCVMGYPAQGRSVDEATLLELMPFNTATLLDAGPEVRVGEVVLERQRSSGLGTYYSAGPFDLGSESLGLALHGGELAPYTGTSDIVFADPLVITSMAPPHWALLGPGDDLALQWTSGGVGDVILETSGTVTHLPDVGRTSVSTEVLGLSAPLSATELSLGRMTYRDVAASGNTIRLQTRRDAKIRVVYADLEGYEPLPEGVAESCEAAAALPVVPPGRYHADASEDEMPVRVVPIEVEAGQRLEVTYRRTTFDAVATLRDADCTSIVQSAPSTDGRPVSLGYEAAADERLHLVLDAGSVDPPADLLTVEWARTPP